MENIVPYNNTNLYAEIKHLIEEARKQVVRSVNSAMVFTYWEIGKRIVEEEQKGENRAEYGTYLLKNLSERLTHEFGKGFNERSLRRIRQFYLLFPIRSALRTELSWMHYRLLFNIEKEEIRNYYLTESIESGWSARQLERQITSFYYERILASQNKDIVSHEAKKNNDIPTAGQLLKNPYVLEFLDLKENKDYLEADLETSLLNKLQDFLLELGKGFAYFVPKPIKRWWNFLFWRKINNCLLRSINYICLLKRS